MLDIRNVTMRFGGLVAVKNASLHVKPGSITGLIGPNGAGKTTLFAVASGFLTPSAGNILLQGSDVTLLPAHARAQRGMARTFQIVQPFAGLSTLENIVVGAFLHHRQRDAAVAAATEVAQRVGLGDDLDRPASGLTVAGRKRLELARALATQPTLLLLDEVLAGLNPSEVRDIIPVIQALRASGITMLMIEHVMQAVMHLCDTVYVLSQGEIVAHGGPNTVVRDPNVVEAYLGHGAAQRLAQEQSHA